MRSTVTRRDDLVRPRLQWTAVVSTPIYLTGIRISLQRKDIADRDPGRRNGARHLYNLARPCWRRSTLHALGDALVDARTHGYGRAPWVVADARADAGGDGRAGVRRPDRDRHASRWDLGR